MHLRTLLTLLATAVFAGSMTAVADGGDDVAESRQADHGECFQTKRVHTISRLDDRHVIAELLGGRRYVLGVEERCRRLDSAVQFSITSRGTRVCPASFAELFFTQRSGPATRCRIETVERLDDTDGDVEDQAAAENDD